MTKTGKVGTFGGIQIPTVTVFMDGFALGVKYYNEQKGTAVEVLGLGSGHADRPVHRATSRAPMTAARFGENLMDEGADIIMPVAGPVGLGTAAVAKERGSGYDHRRRHRTGTSSIRSTARSS